MAETLSNTTDVIERTRINMLFILLVVFAPNQNPASLTACPVLDVGKQYQISYLGHNYLISIEPYPFNYLLHNQK